MTAFRMTLRKISPEQLFMGSTLLVNGGNYLYNLLLGRFLGPGAFADAALMVTLLLVLSFLGMTFQLATAKFAVLLPDEQWKAFEQMMYRYALSFGLFVGILLFAFSGILQEVFHTASPFMFKSFATAIPLYFFMSVNRGKFQGNQQYGKLSLTYQTEMWSRLLVTIALLWLLPFNPGILVAFGIVLSFVFGLIPFNLKKNTFSKVRTLSPEVRKRVILFMVLTASYELTQIIINHSDILLVKHYFNAAQAGLYASLAFIGRVVYYIAWMFVMLLLPTVVQKHKDGGDTTPVLFAYIGYIGLLAVSLVMVCAICPELIIKIMFGQAYISMAPLLWQYALAASLFAVSNIFTYYFLSLDRYLPIVLSGVMGLIQILMILLFHHSLQMVVHVQIMAMITLLVLQLLYFVHKLQS